ncbi:MOSC domain-containing protein [Bacillus salitolerans]|uniref:MOSC domain-containing protein n=1 Tax=Bacillus salitolerans TaxID=1437434 RepID=A0ABW4LUL9_9BACI
MYQKAKLVSLNIGLPKKIDLENEETRQSGVGKVSVPKAYLTKEGFTGDGVQLTKFHGGLDRAILCYCYEHYEKWNKEFNKHLKIPGFGENLTISGLSEENVWIGDIYQIGEAKIQITQSRIPCNTLSKYNGVESLLSKLVETGYTGFLARVLKEGWIYEDSSVSLIERNPNAVSVQYTNEVYFHDKKNIEGIRKILNSKDLAVAWKDILMSRLLKLEKKSVSNETKS